MRVDSLQIRLEQRLLVDISFAIDSSLALVGQSGSGKSITLKALLGMLPLGLVKTGLIIIVTAVR